MCLHRRMLRRDKERQLQALLGLTDAQVAARYGRLAVLFSYDIAGLAPRMQQLLELTGERESWPSLLA